MEIQEKIIIFTDGASRGNPGPGGFGAVAVIFKDGKSEVKEIGGKEEYTTNNRMEISAAIEALSYLNKNISDLPSYPVTLHTDSRYLINGITKWVHGWKKNGWKTIAKQDVENKDLWEKLIDLSQGKSIEWKYIGGHIGVWGNERCDTIATSFADGKKLDLYVGSLEDYPIKNILDFSNCELKENKKSNSKLRSKTKAYSYLSMVGGEIKIHKTWEECEKRVKGVSGARFKKALNGDEEKEIISEWKKNERA